MAGRGCCAEDSFKMAALQARLIWREKMTQLLFQVQNRPRVRVLRPYVWLRGWAFPPLTRCKVDTLNESISPFGGRAI